MFWKKYLNLKLEIFIQIFTNLYGIENARFLFLFEFVTAFLKDSKMKSSFLNNWNLTVNF